MSLPGRRVNSGSLPKPKRGKTVEQKFSFRKQQKSELSIDSIIEQTIKSANLFMGQNASNNEGIAQAAGSLERARMSQSTEGSEVGHRRAGFSWDLIKIEEKRKIKGLKTKLIWSAGKDSVWVVVRAILTDNYKQRISDSDYFVELDSSNVQLKVQEQKQIQKAINKLIEQQQSKPDQQRNEVFNWLKATLIMCHILFTSMKIQDRCQSIKQTEFNRYIINNRYILYPCPSSITWSPHGMLCLSQNKMGNFSRPILGSVHSYRNLLEAPYKYERFARRVNEMEDLRMVEERKFEDEQPTEAEFFGWDPKEEINFAIFGRSLEDQMAPETSKQIPNQQNEKPQKRNLKDKQTLFLGNTNNLSPKMQKIYRRYFCSTSDNLQFEFKQKLKIFTVKSQVVEMEDGILYLIDKIQRTGLNGVTEALLENQFSGYHSIFSKSNMKDRTFEPLKYEIISQFLQQKIKNNPQSQHFLYLKTILIENEMFRLALEAYFEQGFRRLKVNKSIGFLGSYDNFDGAMAQRLLFELLQEHIKAEKEQKDIARRNKNRYKANPSKYDDPDYKRKKYERMEQQNQQMRLFLKGYVKMKSRNLPELVEVESHTSFRKISQELEINQAKKVAKNKLQNIVKKNANFNSMPFYVVNKIQFVPFQFNLILTAGQRKNFIEAIIPILWIKDRGGQKFEYKLAKRVVIANSKVIKFMEVLSHMGNSWKRLQSKKSSFLRKVIQEYHKFRERRETPMGKYYIAYCRECKGDFTAYSLEQLLRVTLCSRCKFLI